jgi:hypothetical protein
MDNDERRLPEATGKWFSAGEIIGAGDGFSGVAPLVLTFSKVPSCTRAGLH